MTIYISSYAEWLGFGLVLGLAGAGIVLVVTLIIWLSWAVKERREVTGRKSGRKSYDGRH